MPPKLNDKPVIRVGGGSYCAIWTLILVGTTQRAVAADPTITFGRRALHRDWITWAVGSDTDPLFDPTLCGEMVGGRFFLNLAPDAIYDCEIPADVTIVPSAGFSIVWKPTDARTDRDLRRVLESTSPAFGPPIGRLDGENVDLDPSWEDGCVPDRRGRALGDPDHRPGLPGGSDLYEDRGGRVDLPDLRPRHR
jgi:hypothetical protein